MGAMRASRSLPTQRTSTGHHFKLGGNTRAQRAKGVLGCVHLDRVEGAGAIDQPAATPQQRCDRPTNTRLARTARCSAIETKNEHDNAKVVLSFDLRFGGAFQSLT